MRPLCRFAQQAEQVETSNLSEIRLDEETLPELRSLTHALNEMLERLSRGFDAQRQFVGNAAHELRTPLTLLQTQLELFPDEHPDIPPESAAFLAALQDEVQRLSRLTHALLDMSDLQSVPRNDVILLSPIIDEVFADLAPLAERNGISLSREGENITVVGSDMVKSMARAAVEELMAGMKLVPETSDPGQAPAPTVNLDDMLNNLDIFKGL